MFASFERGQLQDDHPGAITGEKYWINVLKNE